MLLVTGLAAYFYVHERIGSPKAIPGYETTWKFQLIMFVIFRLPLFLIGLGLLLYLERRFLSRGSSV